MPSKIQAWGQESLLSVSTIPEQTILAGPFRRDYRIHWNQTARSGDIELVPKSEQITKGTRVVLPLVVPARDRWEQNTELHLEGICLYLRAIRPIGAGDHIRVWYSEYYAAQLDIPVLLPRNIKGSQCYICHKCQAAFKFPNPLKDHIKYECHPVKPSTITVCEVSSSEVTEPTLQHPCSPNLRLSKLPAYKDSRKQFKKTDNVADVQSDLVYTHAKALNCRRMYAITEDTKKHLVFRKDCEPIDQIPQSVYTCTSGKGHVCIYCGKLYSRKYGLKIHLRTHTGYKPLKCKFCSRPFGDPSNLNKHIRLHAPNLSETPYKCALCSKILARKRDLERHVKSRH